MLRDGGRILSIRQAIRSTGEIGTVLEQHQDTIRWEECLPDQSALIGCQSSEKCVLVQTVCAKGQLTVDSSHGQRVRAVRR
jgi:hypothetical protein